MSLVPRIQGRDATLVGRRWSTASSPTACRRGTRAGTPSAPAGYRSRASTSSPTPSARSVDIDDEGAARQTAEHLLALGHRRFGIVLTHEEPAHDRGRGQRRRRLLRRGARLAGWRAAIEAAGIDWDDVPVAGAVGHGRARPRRRRPAARPRRAPDRDPRALRPARHRRPRRRRGARHRRPRRPVGRGLRRHPRGRDRHAHAHHRPSAAPAQGRRGRPPAPRRRPGAESSSSPRSSSSELRPVPLPERSPPHERSAQRHPHGSRIAPAATCTSRRPSAHGARVACAARCCCQCAHRLDPRVAPAPRASLSR